jgi:hypothetical protein
VKETNTFISELNSDSVGFRDARDAANALIEVCSTTVSGMKEKGYKLTNSKEINDLVISAKQMIENTQNADSGRTFKLKRQKIADAYFEWSKPGLFMQIINFIIQFFGGIIAIVAKIIGTIFGIFIQSSLKG